MRTVANRSTSPETDAQHVQISHFERGEYNMLTRLLPIFRSPSTPLLLKNKTKAHGRNQQAAKIMLLIIVMLLLIFFFLLLFLFLFLFLLLLLLLLLLLDWLEMLEAFRCAVYTGNQVPAPLGGGGGGAFRIQQTRMHLDD